MTDDTELDLPLRTTEMWRLATLVIGSAEIIAFLLLVHLALMSVDPLGDAAGIPATALLAAPVVVLTLPGLLLAWLGRAPRLALALVVAAIPAALVIWIEA